MTQPIMIVKMSAFKTSQFTHPLTITLRYPTTTYSIHGIKITIVAEMVFRKLDYSISIPAIVYVTAFSSLNIKLANFIHF